MQLETDMDICIFSAALSSLRWDHVPCSARDNFNSNLHAAGRPLAPFGRSEVVLLAPKCDSRDGKSRKKRRRSGRGAQSSQVCFGDRRFGRVVCAATLRGNLSPGYCPAAGCGGERANSDVADRQVYKFLPAATQCENGEQFEAEVRSSRGNHTFAANRKMCGLDNN